MTIDFEKLEERAAGVRVDEREGQGRRRDHEHDRRQFTSPSDGERHVDGWEADVKIAGPVGSMGQRVLQPIVNQQVGNVLAALEKQVAEAAAATPDMPDPS